MQIRTIPKEPRGRDSHLEWTGMLVVSLRGVNFRFWSHLGCSGQNAIIFTVEVWLRVAREEITKATVLFICLFYKPVSFRGLHKLRPHTDWSLLGVRFKISDEHPRPLHVRVLPPPGKKRTR